MDAILDYTIGATLLTVFRKSSTAYTEIEYFSSIVVLSGICHPKWHNLYFVEVK